MSRPLITTAVVAGALCWLAKVGVIVATDGRVTDDGIAGVLFGIGGALLLAGAVGLGVQLARHRPTAVRTAAGLGGAVALAASVIVLAVLASAVVPSSVAQHLTDEVSTVLASIGWIAAATWIHRRAPTPA